MLKHKNWPKRIEIVQKDAEKYTTKTNIDDPGNLFLGRKIVAGQGITVEEVASYENTYLKITNLTYIGGRSGTMYVIPIGTSVVVENNYQYLIKDYLYLTGGTISLCGNAQLKIH